MPNYDKPIGYKFKDVFDDTYAIVGYKTHMGSLYCCCECIQGTSKGKLALWSFTAIKRSTNEIKDSEN